MKAHADAEYDYENWVFLSLRLETDLCNQFSEKKLNIVMRRDWFDVVRKRKDRDGS